MYVDWQKIKNYAKTLETKNLKKFGRSMSWVTIMDSSHITIEEREGYSVVHDDWRDRMKSVSMPQDQEATK